MAKFTVADRDDVGMSQLPAGEHLVEVAKAEMKEGPRANYIAIQVRALEGEIQGRMGFTNLSLSTKAQWKLNRFLDATGIAKETKTCDTDELVGKQLFVKVEEVEQKDGEYAGTVRNEITGFVSVKEFMASKAGSDSNPKGGPPNPAPAPTPAAKVNSSPSAIEI